MEDLRKRNISKKQNNIMKFYNIINFFKNNWLILSILIVIVSIIFFPMFTGGLVGNWLNTLVTSFLGNIHF